MVVGNKNSFFHHFVYSSNPSLQMSYYAKSEVPLVTKDQGNDEDNEILFTDVEAKDDNKEIEENANQSQAENEEISCKTVCKLV